MYKCNHPIAIAELPHGGRGGICLVVAQCNTPNEPEPALLKLHAPGNGNITCLASAKNADDDSDSGYVDVTVAGSRVFVVPTFAASSNTAVHVFDGEDLRFLFGIRRPDNLHELRALTAISPTEIAVGGDGGAAATLYVFSCSDGSPLRTISLPDCGTRSSILCKLLCDARRLVVAYHSDPDEYDEHCEHTSEGCCIDVLSLEGMELCQSFQDSRDHEEIVALATMTDGLIVGRFNFPNQHALTHFVPCARPAPPPRVPALM